MFRKVTHCAGRGSANTRPHQLRWGDQEMGTAISCTKCSQVAGLIQKLVETPRTSCTHLHIHEQSMNHISLNKASLDVMQSHPVHRTHFGQYQASSAALGWPCDGDGFIMQERQSSDWPYPYNKVVSYVHVAVLLKLLLQALLIIECTCTQGEASELLEILAWTGVSWCTVVFHMQGSLQ